MSLELDFGRRACSCDPARTGRQVAVGGMHLDAVEAGGESVTRRVSVLLDAAKYLFRLQCARRRDRLDASFCEALRLRYDGVTRLRPPERGDGDGAIEEAPEV